VSSSTRGIDVSVLRLEIVLFWDVTPWQDFLTSGRSQYLRFESAEL